MGFNRRSFLRALIGVPFAAKAIEGIIARGISAPVPSPALPPPAPIKVAVPVDKPVMWQLSGDAISVCTSGVVRVREVGLLPLQPGDLVKVNGFGLLEKCAGEEAVIGRVVRTTHSTMGHGGGETVVDVDLFGGQMVSQLNHREWETSYERMPAWSESRYYP